MILRALEIGGEGYGPEDVLHEIREGRARVFTSDHASMVVEIDGHTAHIWLAGGRLRDVLELHLEVERWARANGYHELTIEGRKGWERLLPRYGFEICGTMLRKALTHGKKEKENHDPTNAGHDAQQPCVGRAADAEPDGPHQ